VKDAAVMQSIQTAMVETLKKILISVMFVTGESEQKLYRRRRIRPMTKRERVYALKNYALLRQARNIFGTSRVKDAWKLSMYSQSDKDYWLRHAKESPYLSEDNDIDTIDIDGIDVVLLFDNGKYVQFGSSEWGVIKTLKKELIILE